jgi:hypothetical protein
MFTKIFDSVAGALSTFVLGWAIPSAVTVGAFAVFVFPQVQDRWPFDAIHRAATLNVVAQLGVLGFLVVTLSVLFAYTQEPIYRLLEGYTLPRVLRRRLYRREIRSWRMAHGARRFEGRGGLLSTQASLELEKGLYYPEDRGDVQATRLGNALRAMETYATSRFDLDSQTLWYELTACAPSRVVKEVEEGRAMVDLFVSSIVHFALLAVVCFGIALWVRSWHVLVVGLVALLLTRPAYNSAVRNVSEFRAATQALIHTGRKPLAEQLGFELPMSMLRERMLWRRFSEFVYKGDSEEPWAVLDRFRVRSASATGGSSPPASSSPSSASSS